ncbi:lysophospholipid acyltransferase family protein [Zoogloea sp.]|uniref:lysophospholipid acyltransferase family protein n=1 Tax=Zoogloea sp. TaxID=49181 RepID=UPI0035AE59A6
MFVDHLLASALCGFARALTGVRALWLGSEPDARPRVYFANHRSHGDFVLIWASLPPPLRRRTRPVAGADYWLTTPLRRFLINRVFRGVCIDRRPGRSGPNPVEQMGEALTARESLILFPEGTRNMGDGLLPFKSGLHHLAKAHPEVELIPVWIENLGRVMPKGSLIPVPLLCTLSFGPPLAPIDGESRDAFLARARTALLDLAPPAD